MNGFFHYFLNAIRPDVLLGELRFMPQLAGVIYNTIGPLSILVFIRVALFHLGAIAIWIVSIVRPEIIYPSRNRAAMRSLPVVSIIVPALNEAGSIRHTLQSILNCGYPNLDIIFIDDGSTDQTAAIARRVANSIGGETGRVKRIRVFSEPYRNGKPSALNLGIRMARGEFVIIIDADTELQYGTIQHWLVPFSNPRIGAVSGNIRVLNATDSLITRLQEAEYALRLTLNPLIFSRLNILPIIPGPGGMFRMAALRELGGFDTGLGDDSDLSMRLLKAGWRLTNSVEAVVWTHAPPTLWGLTRQRQRWTKNTVRIRLSKHHDMLSPTVKYGFANLVRALIVLNRVTQAGLWFLIIVIAVLADPLAAPDFFTQMYFFVALWFVIRTAITRDIAAAPPPRAYLLTPLMPFYFLYLRIVTGIEIANEVFKIRPYNRYVPAHIWQEVPPW